MNWLFFDQPHGKFCPHKFCLVFQVKKLTQLSEFLSINEKAPGAVFLIPAAVLALLGWLIKFKKVTWLISGYNTASKKEKERYDVDKLCRHMGNFIFTLAGIFLMMALAGIVFEKDSGAIITFGFLVLFAVIVGGLVYLNTGRRFLKD